MNFEDREAHFVAVYGGAEMSVSGARGIAGVTKEEVQEAVVKAVNASGLDGVALRLSA